MKLTLKLTLVFVTIGLAFSAVADLESNCGAGLGTQLWKGHDGLIQQLFAVTTNASCGNQTLAITSGTLGASKPDGLVKNETIQRFVAENMDNLARDIATGGGESLTTLAILMDVPTKERTAFASQLRTNFDTIYGSEDVTSRDVVKAIAELRV